MADWSSLIGGLGIGSVIGGLVQQYFSAKQRHHEWVKDNRKQEWRELIAVLSQSVHRILQNMPDLRFDGIIKISGEQEKQLLEAYLEARRIIEDRLFISSRVQSENVLERWQLIAGEKDPARILEYWNHLHSALVDFAHKDLGIKN